MKPPSASHRGRLVDQRRARASRQLDRSARRTSGPLEQRAAGPADALRAPRAELRQAARARPAERAQISRRCRAERQAAAEPLEVRTPLSSVDQLLAQSGPLSSSSTASSRAVIAGTLPSGAASHATSLRAPSAVTVRSSTPEQRAACAPPSLSVLQQLEVGARWPRRAPGSRRAAAALSRSTWAASRLLGVLEVAQRRAGGADRQRRFRPSPKPSSEAAPGSGPAGSAAARGRLESVGARSVASAGRSPSSREQRVEPARRAALGHQQLARRRRATARRASSVQRAAAAAAKNSPVEASSSAAPQARRSRRRTARRGSCSRAASSTSSSSTMPGVMIRTTSRRTMPGPPPASSTCSQMATLSPCSIEPGDVAARRVVRAPRTSGTRSAPLAREVSVIWSSSAALHRVLEEHLVEVAEPEEEDRVRVARLGLQVLPHHRRERRSLARRRAPRPLRPSGIPAAWIATSSICGIARHGFDLHYHPPPTRQARADRSLGFKTAATPAARGC